LFYINLYKTRFKIRSSVI